MFSFNINKKTGVFNQSSTMGDSNLQTEGHSQGRRKYRESREIKPVQESEESSSFLDKNTMMTLGAFGLLAAAGFYLWRENQKTRAALLKMQSDFQISHQQVQENAKFVQAVNYKIDNILSQLANHQEYNQLQNHQQEQPEEHLYEQQKQQKEFNQKKEKNETKLREEMKRLEDEMKHKQFDDEDEIDDKIIEVSEEIELQDDDQENYEEYDRKQRKADKNGKAKRKHKNRDNKKLRSEDSVLEYYQPQTGMDIIVGE